MKRRIRKKKVKQEIAYIDFLISRNKQKIKEEHKRPAIRLASVLIVLGLSFHKAILVKKLKRGNY